MAFNAQFFQAEAPRSFSDVVNEGLDTGTKFRAVDRKKKLQDLIAKHTIVDEKGIGTLNDVPFLTEAKALGISDEAVPYHAQAKGVLSDSTLKEARAAQALEDMGLSPNALRATPPTDLPMTKGAGSNESTTAGLVDNLRSPAEIAAEQEAKALAGGNTATVSAPAVATPAPVTDTATPDKRTQLEEFLKTNYGKKSKEVEKIQNALGITGKAADGKIDKGGNTEKLLRRFFGMNESPEAGISLSGGEMKPVYADNVNTPDGSALNKFYTNENPAYDFQTELTAPRVRAEPDPFLLPADDTMYSTTPSRGPMSAIEESLQRDPNAKGKPNFDIQALATAPAGSTDWEPVEGGSRYTQYKTALDKTLKQLGFKTVSDYLKNIYKSEFLSNAPKVPNDALLSSGTTEDRIKYNAEVQTYNQGLQIAQGKALTKLQGEKDKLAERAQQLGVNYDTSETHKLDVEAKNAEMVGRRAGPTGDGMTIRTREVSPSEKTDGDIYANAYLDFVDGKNLGGFEGALQMSRAAGKADKQFSKETLVADLMAQGQVPTALARYIKDLLSEGGSGLTEEAIKWGKTTYGDIKVDHTKQAKWIASKEKNIRSQLQGKGYDILGSKPAPSKTDKLGATLGKKAPRAKGESYADYLRRTR